MGRPAYQPASLWPRSASEMPQSLDEEKEIYGEDDSVPLMTQDIALRHSKRRRFLPYLIHVVLFAAALFIAFSGQVAEHFLTEQICIKKLNPYSPVIENQVVRYEWQYWDNDHQNENPYRGPPTVERELAWLDLWAPAVKPDGGVPVPLERLAELNKTVNNGLQRTKTGDAAGFVEVFHNMHCISTLREWVYKDQYMERLGAMPAVFDKTLDEQMEHIDHCIERIRLALMCSADLSVTFVYDDPDAPMGVTPDFDGMHKCRNFHEIKDWVEQHNH